MATKKKSTGSRKLFRLEEKGATADKKGNIYQGYVGGYDIGAVVAPNKTAGKKKLLSIARKILS